MPGDLQIELDVYGKCGPRRGAQKNLLPLAGEFQRQRLILYREDHVRGDGVRHSELTSANLRVNFTLPAQPHSRLSVRNAFYVDSRQISAPLAALDVCVVLDVDYDVDLFRTDAPLLEADLEIV